MLTPFEIVIAVVNIVAVVLAPIVAVVIGQYLQDRSERRKDKMEIFKSLMANRSFDWTVEGARALNIIDIVFSDSPAVREKWKDYYDLLCIQNPDIMQKQKINIAKDKLLESMANSLGYKDVVTWENIQNPYMPKGMLSALQQQQIIQNGQEKWAGAIDYFTQMLAEQSIPNVNAPQEDKSHADA